MSDSDSFINEVTEEVRRDRLFALMRRYGWIAVLAVLAIVGAAAWSEYTRAQDRARAQALGDALTSALDREGDARLEALAQIDPSSPGGVAMVAFLRASELAATGREAEAATALERVAAEGELPEIYRQIASFKALTLQADTLPPQDRALRFEALLTPGSPLRLLAQEQLALIAVETGDTALAIERFTEVLQDAEASADLQQRASQAIVALGGTVPQQTAPE